MDASPASRTPPSKPAPVPAFSAAVQQPGEVDVIRYIICVVCQVRPPCPRASLPADAASVFPAIVLSPM